ncbi:hypothetical protein EIN_489830, partial [Entamoeba invadens IP1]
MDYVNLKSKIRDNLSKLQKFTGKSEVIKIMFDVITDLVSLEENSISQIKALQSESTLIKPKPTDILLQHDDPNCVSLQSINLFADLLLCPQEVEVYNVLSLWTNYMNFEIIYNSLISGLDPKILNEKIASHKNVMFMVLTSDNFVFG